MHWEPQLENARPGHEIAIPMVSPASLKAYGYYESTGLPTGQYADYRRALPDGRGIHVKLYRGRATAHIDRVDPSKNLIGHLLRDAPVFTVAVGALLFGLLASRLGKTG